MKKHEIILVKIIIVITWLLSLLSFIYFILFLIELSKSQLVLVSMMSILIFYESATMINKYFKHKNIYIPQDDKH